MNQVFCPKCGHANRSGMKFCAKCGAPLPPPRSTTPTPPPQSAEPTPPAAPPHQPPAEPPIMPDGGLPRDPYPPPMPSPPPENRRRTWVLIGILLVVVVALVLAVVLLFLPSREDDPVVEETPAAELEDDWDGEMVETAVPTPTDTPEPTAVSEEAPSPASEETPEAPPALVNLLDNGDFTQSWEFGWQRIIGESATGIQRVEVTDGEPGEPERLLHIERSGSDQLQLTQTVDVPPGALRFSAELKLIGSSSEENGVEGMAALLLVYLDTERNPLGYSIWINGSQRSSTLFGVDPLPNFGINVSPRWGNEDWRQINLDVRQEINNSLPTVDPDEVTAIQVILLGIGSDNCAPDQCYVNIQAANLFLTAEE
jgi:hypothetical protein